MSQGNEENVIRGTNNKIKGTKGDSKKNGRKISREKELL